MSRKSPETTKIRIVNDIVSFNVENWYTQVCITESINLAAKKRYCWVASVDKDNFKTMSRLCCSDNVLLSNIGVYIYQKG